MKACTLLLLSLLASDAAVAGRPMLIDDAGLTDAHSCQLETWLQSSSKNRERWFLPACNPYGNFEVAAGVAEFQTDGAAVVRSLALQGKTLLRPFDTGDWGVGLAFGTVRPEHGRGGSDYAYVPLSVSRWHDSLVAHFNLGWSRDRALDADRTTWGAGAEYAVANRVTVFAEILGDNATRPTMHGGFSFALVPGRVKLDLSFGRNMALGNGANFCAAGIDIYLPP